MITDLFAIESAIEHIAVAQEHELLVVAPATADLMAKFAHGLADDFLTTCTWLSPARWCWRPP